MKSVIILSGGMDSTVALYKAINEGRDVTALSFNYGSKHNEAEFEHAKRTCEKFGIRHERISLGFIDDLFCSDLLKSGGNIPEGHYADPNMKKTVVPFRNGIMLAIAVGFAESIGAESVIIGNHYGDHAVYPDCREEFIEYMNRAARSGTYAGVRIDSPFCEISKTDIAKIGRKLNVNWADTYSCYNGREKHCGKCGTCFERKEAFRDAGVPDVTDYE